jgi:digeranylgeranylglycerophospholipid reductase
MVEVPFSEAYDIVVIGAGPAGSSAARAAAARGAKVLVIDRRRRIGVPVQCGEYVPRAISRYVHFSSSSVVQEIETMITHLPDGSSHEMKSPGFMLDRSLFDLDLATAALRAGAQIATGTRGVRLAPEGVVIERHREEKVLRSKVIIGADGARSSVGRWVSQRPSRRIVALQCEIVNPNPRSDVDVFFLPDYEGGYAWFFPKGRTANAGVGVAPAKISALPALLNHFLGLLKNLGRVPTLQIVRKTAGAIPCTAPSRTVFGNILLAGDAAGHAHPITGAGILNAVIGGEMAGRIAAEAILSGNLAHLENYEGEWREVFGTSLSYGASKRDYLESHWKEPDMDFEELVRTTWVGFKEYYDGRRSWSARSGADSQSG